MNASSLARTSASIPAARSRARFKAGSTRVVTIIRAFAGMCARAMVDRGQAFLVRHCVEVVEHDDQAGAERRDAVHQLVHGVLDRAARNAEPSQRAPSEPWPYAIDRRRHVPPQPGRIVVAGVERDPCHRGVPARTPVAHRGRLAVPGRGSDERQRAVATGIERLPDARSVDHASTQARERELGLDERGQKGRAARFGSPLRAVSGFRRHSRRQSSHQRQARAPGAAGSAYAGSCSGETTGAGPVRVHPSESWCSLARRAATRVAWVPSTQICCLISKGCALA